MPATRLVAVGAVACDIILGVPFYPEEDSKLRATSFHKRRGGNVGNTIEVLQQLLVVQKRHQAEDSGGSQAIQKNTVDVALTLVAALPTKSSPAIDFIASSFNGRAVASLTDQRAEVIVNDDPSRAVSMHHCLYRDGYDEPVTSYIISSEANRSRTIVNHNALPEMTFAEFTAISGDLLRSDRYSPDRPAEDQFWVHFEGRIPETTLKCMGHLRKHDISTSEKNENTDRPRLMISVEVEKPGREGLQDLARMADVVFYSRSWAEGEGYSSAEDCLRKQAVILQGPSHLDFHRPQQRLLVCTWGSNGACGILVDRGASEYEVHDEGAIIHSQAHRSESRPIVDTTGAGDTFIAGMLYQLLGHDFSRTVPKSILPESSQLREYLDFANALAGRKVLQYGFADLGKAPG